MESAGAKPQLKPFLVELRPAAAGWHDIQAIGARARAVCSQLRDGGTPVRFLRSLFVPEDDTCFLLYRAESAEAVAEAARRTALVVSIAQARDVRGEIPELTDVSAPSGRKAGLHPETALESEKAGPGRVDDVEEDR